MISTGKELALAMENVAKNYKTLYVMGCFGAPMTEYNKNRYILHHEYNQDLKRVAMINASTDDVFGFDCVCLIKALLWGWHGDKTHGYGGSVYKSNGVPDINADQMIHACSRVSPDFSNIEVGEAVWMPGHIGIYIGDGLAVECTPIWDDGVQITSCNCYKPGYHRRDWSKHGKLPYVDYDLFVAPTPAKKSVEEIAKEVVAGKWGVGDARKVALTKAGYNYSEVQAKVNELCNGTPVKKITVGCRVKVKPGARSYNGANVAEFIYKNVYTVDSLSGKRAVLNKKGICTAFNVDDLIVQ